MFHSEFKRYIIANRFQKEISSGFKIINRYKGNKATIFGSHKVTDGDFFIMMLFF